MSVTAVCTGCQKAFKAPDQYAGKKVKCKNCGTAFRVPELTAAPAAAGAKAAPAGAARASVGTKAAAPGAPARKPAAAKVAKPVERDDHGEYGLSNDDDWSLQAAAPAPAYVPSAAAVAAGRGQVAAAPAPALAYQPAVSRGTVFPSTAQPMSARRGASAAGEGMSVLMMVQLGAFGLPLLVLILGMMIPALSTVGILLATFVSVAFMLWGQIGILVVALQESSLCGLLYLFLPFYPLYYILTRFEDCAPYVIRTIAGFALMAGAIMMILSQSPN
jgi:hypothetical protein